MSSRIRASVQALHPYVPGEQPKGPGVVKLNTNENPHGPSPRVGEVLRAFDHLQARLYPDPVCSALREAAARLHGVTPDMVFFGNGSDEVLALCTRAFVEDDGVVSYFEPSYSLYPVLCDIADVRHAPVPLTDDYRWAMPADHRSNLFLLTNPNAPTSLGFDPADIRRFAAGYAGVVVVDEAYADFAGRDCLALARELPNVIISRTFSKAYGLAHLRLGYAVGPAPLIEALYKIKDSYNVNGLTQAAGLAALLDQEYLRATVARILATRARVTAALEGRGWHVLPSETNFLFAEPPGGDAARIFQGLKDRRIFVRYFPGPRTGRRLRVTIGTDAEMDAFLAAIDSLSSQPR